MNRTTRPTANARRAGVIRLSANGSARAKYGAAPSNPLAGERVRSCNRASPAHGGWRRIRNRAIAQPTRFTAFGPALVLFRKTWPHTLGGALSLRCESSPTLFGERVTVDGQSADERHAIGLGEQIAVIVKAGVNSPA